MKFILPLTLVLTLVFTACGPSKVQEGEIEYVVTYPHTELEGFVSAILPEKMVLIFKGSKVKSEIKRGRIFQTEIVSYEKDRSIEMRLDFGNDDYYATLTKEDIDKLIASQPKYKIEATGEADSVNGLFGKAYTVKNPVDSITHVNSWFCEDLAPEKAYWYSSYKEINGVPLVFDIERYGIIMHMEISKFTAREVKDEEFARNPDLKEVTFEEYEAKVQDLFDILLDE